MPKAKTTRDLESLEILDGKVKVHQRETLKQKDTFYIDELNWTEKQKKFIENDPIIIPHDFNNKLDIEISGFIISIISWGNRKSIINSGYKIITFLESSPYDFIINHSDQDLKRIKGNIHRTFKSEDLIYFIKSLKNIYTNYKGLEGVMSNDKNGDNLQERISNFKKKFFELKHPKRTKKHFRSTLPSIFKSENNWYVVLFWWISGTSRSPWTWSLWSGWAPIRFRLR